MKKVVCNTKDCPAPLKPRQKYKIMRETNLYSLQGVDGQFNSVFFDLQTNDYAFAIASQMPIEGKRFKCNKVVLKNDTVELKAIRTSTVQSVRLIGRNTYEVITSSIIYIVKFKL